MKLSEWIYNYRKAHALSMQGMADLCGLSKQYISVLEKGINPNTKKEFVPSIETVKKIADATRCDFNSLIALLGQEQDIAINSVNPFPKFDNIITDATELEQELITDFRKLNPAGQTAAAAAVKSFTQMDRFRKDTEKIQKADAG